MCCYLFGGRDEGFQRKPEWGNIFRRQVSLHIAKQSRSSASVAGDSLRTALPRFHPSRGQFDQPLQIVRRHSLATAGMPDLFPRFMSFPVVAMIEQLNAPEVLFVLHGILGCQRLAGLDGNSKAVPSRIAKRMWKHSRNVGVDGKLTIGK